MRRGVLCFLLFSLFPSCASTTFNHTVWLHDQLENCPDEFKHKGIYRVIIVNGVKKDEVIPYCSKYITDYLSIHKDDL